MPVFRAIWLSWGGGRFLMSEVSLYRDDCRVVYAVTVDIDAISGKGGAEGPPPP